MSDSDSDTKEFRTGGKKSFVYDSFDNFPGSVRKFWTKTRLIGAGIVLALLIILIVLVVVFTTKKSDKDTKTNPESNFTTTSNANETTTLAQTTISLMTPTPGTTSASASTSTSTSCSTPVDQLIYRLDCYPEPGASESLCIARGCKWDPCDVGTLSAPKCFYPDQSNRYQLDANPTDPNSLTLTINSDNSIKARPGDQNDSETFVDS